METDALIQKTVRTQFADRTVLTIAHRLATVMVSATRSPHALSHPTSKSSRADGRGVRVCASPITFAFNAQDSDRVLVMDSGRVGEFDKPAVLLQRSATVGLLSSMVESTGPQSAERLRMIAQGAVDIFGNRVL